MSQIVTYGNYIHCSEKNTAAAYDECFKEAVNLLCWLTRNGLVSVQKAELTQRAGDSGHATVRYRLECEMKREGEP